MFPLPPHFLSPPAPFPRPLFGDLMAMSSNNNNMDSSTASLLQSPLLQLLLLDQQQRQQQREREQQQQQLALALQQLLGPLLLKEGMEHSAAMEEPASAAAKVDETGGSDQQFWHNILTTMGAAEPLSSEQPSSSESAGRTTTASAEEMPKEAKPPTKALKRHRPAEAEESTMAAKLVGGGTKKKRRRGRVLEVETDSPVAGMFIKEACDEEELRRAAEASELDDSAAFVHVTEESRQAIAAIPDIIGPARCALCKILFDDLFRLAMHRCPRIRHQEYRCEECEKVFSCPANLASHRRWHLPKTSAAESKRRPKGGHARHDPPMPVVDENGEEAEETEDKLEKMDKTEEEKGEEAFEDGGHLLMLQMAHQGLRERLAEAATALITLGLAK